MVYEYSEVERAAIKLAQSINTSVANLDAGTSMAVFSHRDHVAGSYVRNTNLWCRALASQLTGVVAVKYTGGEPGLFGPMWMEARGGVAITKRHILMCRHGIVHASYGGVPTLFRFVDTNGNVIDRYGVAEYSEDGEQPDMSVVLLDSDLPDSIHVFPVLTLNTAAWNAALPTATAIGVSQGSDTNVGEEIQAYTCQTISLWEYGQHPYGGYPGDSGTPRFYLDKTTLYMASLTGAAQVYSNIDYIAYLITNCDALAVEAESLTEPTGYSALVIENPYLTVTPRVATLSIIANDSVPHVITKPMNNKRLLNKYSMMGKIGSFWGSSLTPASVDRARKLVHFVDHVGALGSLNQAVQQMAGLKKIPFEHRVFRLQATDTVPISEDFQKRIRTTLGTDTGTVVITRRPDTLDTTGWSVMTDDLDSAMADETESVLVFPSDSPSAFLLGTNLRPMYALKIPFNVVIMAVEVAGRTLLAGMDFVQQPGLLLFNEHPETILGGVVMVVRSGWEIIPSPLCHTMRLDDVSGSTEYVAALYRGNTSAKSFELAIAQAAGLTITPSDCVILQVVGGSANSKTYVTSTGILDVPYRHTAMTIGTELSANSVVGGAVKVVSGQTGMGNWWREADLSGGISLDPYCPIKGLTIPDRNILCEAAESSGDNIHVRLHLEGSQYALTGYWAMAKEAERVSGKFLNDFVGLSSIGDKKFLNGIDLLFESLLVNSSMIVELRTEALGSYYHDRALAFIQREKPVNITTIINSL